ncbi:hypothetical protein MB84_31375 (plasmid) [Pandoraea oxalativorans]|uniref:Uncharacterized protein n=1 Tax=Pandoraea oxalativorans TaxID=573737 RepID=A0A192B0R7_9BURK|nr:hypothetical protein MB84_31375 [Pandoraea oxalativorans]
MTDENRLAQQQPLRDAFEQYETAKLRYARAENEAIRLCPRHHADDMSAQTRQAQAALAAWQEEFKGLSRAHDDVVSAHTAYENWGDVDDAMRHVLTQERECIDFDFKCKSSLFGQRLSILSQPEHLPVRDVTAFETTKIKYQRLKDAVQMLINNFRQQINSQNAIDIPHIKAISKEIDSKLSSMNVLHQHLHDTSHPGNESGEKALKAIEDEHELSAFEAENTLAEIRHLLTFATPGNELDYTDASGVKRILILTHDSAAHTACVKVPDTGLYDGGWAGQPHGKGTVSLYNGSRYTGDWRDGRRHGKGSHIWPNGIQYTGMWAENVAHGDGIFDHPAGLTTRLTLQNGVCARIAEGAGNRDWFNQMMLDAVDNGAPEGYAESALLLTAQDMGPLSSNPQNDSQAYVDYRNAMLALVKRAHQWMLCSEADRARAWQDNLKINGNGILFNPSMLFHSIKIEILPPVEEGGRYALTLFNSGKGLLLHPYSIDTKKFETRLSVYINSENEQTLRDIFLSREKLDIGFIYQFALQHRSEPPSQNRDAQIGYGSVYQSPQSSENCSIKSWMAVFKNKALQMNEKLGLSHYNRFRNEFLKHALTLELETSSFALLRGEAPKNDVKAIARVHYRTITRLGDIAATATRLFPGLLIEGFFAQHAAQLYPRDTEKQQALVALTSLEKMKDLSQAILSGNGWLLTDVLRAAAFSKIIKRELQTQALTSH